ncbi:hypothetical protein NQZ68_024410 [Dissostichus eleginoides]|nr:hypothetical protein NQZ68_024410 [Dissostichus eleginoides]
MARGGLAVAKVLWFAVVRMDAEEVRQGRDVRNIGARNRLSNWAGNPKGVLPDQKVASKSQQTSPPFFNKTRVTLLKDCCGFTCSIIAIPQPSTTRASNQPACFFLHHTCLPGSQSSLNCLPPLRTSIFSKPA